MSAFQDTYRSLYGAWRMAHFDAQGMQCFDISPTGFWKSFQSAIVGVPLFLILAFLEQKIRIMVFEANYPGQNITFSNYYLLQVIEYFAIWPVFALIAIPFTRLVRMDRFYVPMIIAYNWARVMSIAILIPAYALMASGLLSNTISSVVALLSAIVVISYQWFVLKTGLGGNRLLGVAMVVTDIVLASLLSYGLSALFGGGAAIPQ